MAHVTSVHYAISNPFIYTIIFYFIKSVTYLWAGATSHVAFVHYDVPPIPYLHHYLLFLVLRFIDVL